MAPLEMIAPLITAPDSMIAVPPALTKLLLAVAPELTSSTPPLLTVVLVTSPPLATSSVPFLIVQWAVLALLTVQTPPTTSKVVKPLYCVPIELRSNVSEPNPPSWKVLSPEGSTVPLMV